MGPRGAAGPAGARILPPQGEYIPGGGRYPQGALTPSPHKAPRLAPPPPAGLFIAEGSSADIPPGRFIWGHFLMARVLLCASALSPLPFSESAILAPPFPRRGFSFALAKIVLLGCPEFNAESIRRKCRLASSASGPLADCAAWEESSAAARRFMGAGPLS